MNFCDWLESLEERMSLSGLVRRRDNSSLILDDYIVSPRVVCRIKAESSQVFRYLQSKANMNKAQA